MSRIKVISSLVALALLLSTSNVSAITPDEQAFLDAQAVFVNRGQEVSDLLMEYGATNDMLVEQELELVLENASLELYDIQVYDCFKTFYSYALTAFDMVAYSLMNNRLGDGERATNAAYGSGIAKMMADEEMERVVCDGEPT